MGYIFKYVLPILVIYWIFRSIGRFMTRMMGGGNPQQRNTHQQQKSTRPADGNVRVEYAPKNKNEKSADNFKGGDYVDYEEVD